MKLGVHEAKLGAHEAALGESCAQLFIGDVITETLMMKLWFNEMK